MDWQAFYADVAASGLPFATPVILGVEEVDGRSVTLERECAAAQRARRRGHLTDSAG
jgi:hypothetical protein